jgi:hypothetical protein
VKFRAWHGECQTFAEGDTIEAETAAEAAKKLVFVYYAGDCDRGADTVRAVPEQDRWIATRKNSPDYYFITQEDA